jgi:hypothetical protein
LSGAVSDSVTCDDNGNFSDTLQAPAQPGNVTATATDNQQNASAPSKAAVPAAVVITSLTVTLQTGTTVQLSGTVQDNNPGATVTVTFSGAATGSTTAAADGTFSVTIQNCQLGTVTATASDNQGNSSAPVTASITCAPPSIINFDYTQGNNGAYVFTGQVIAQSPGGLEVTFGGITQLIGQDVLTNNDGTFSITVVILTPPNCDATAQVTDCWGQQSAVATCAMS